MIDKVDLRVPADTPYSRQFSVLYQEIRNDPKGPFRSSQHYVASADLRQYDHPVILHTHCLHGSRGNHKLELVDAGTMTYSQMFDEIARVFEIRPESLPVMRVDLAADVAGVSVMWFEQHVRAQYKRWTADMGKLASEDQFARMGKQGVETLYFGRRPNMFRIYNKISECRAQFRRQLHSLRRSLEDDVQLPTFEQAFGYPETGLILTRVERQISGRVPDLIGTFGQLREASKFNPFEALIFSDAGKPSPNPDDYDLQTYAMGMLVQSLVDEGGFHRAKQFLNEHSKRNANRILKRVADFLPADHILMCSEKLFDLYRRSVSKQLAA